MINRVILSGILVDEEVKLVKDANKPNFAMAEVTLLTNNGKKDEIKEVKIVLFNKFAIDLQNKQEIYKTHLCMYFGEVVYYHKTNETKIKINEPIQVLASVGDKI